MCQPRSLRSALGAFGLLLAVSAATAGTAADDVAVDSPYASGIPGTPLRGAVYMVLRNTAFRDHALVAAHSSAARSLELQTPAGEAGVAPMRKIQQIDVRPAGQEVLQPGGLQIGLMDLLKPLGPTDSVTVELEFEDGSRKTIDAPVRDGR